MSNKDTMRERLRARRQKLQDTTAEEEPQEPSPRDSRYQDTWAAAMEETVEGGGTDTGGSSVDILDEMKESDALVKKLKKRRKEKQKELSEALLSTEEKDNVSEQMKSVKAKSKKKVLKETSKRPPRPEGVTPLPELKEQDDDDGTIKSATETGGQDEADGTALAESQPSPARSTKRSARKTPRDGQPREDGSLGTTGASDVHRLSMSLTQESLRKRLSAKLRSAKEKGETEAMDETRTERRLAGLRKMQRATRFDDPSLMTEEDQETERKSARYREKWKKVTEKSVEKSLLPTPDEQFDFFTRNFEPEVEETEQKEDKPAAEPEPSTSAAQEGETPEEETPKIDEDKPEDEQPLLNEMDFEENAWKFYQFGRLPYVPYSERQKQEEEVYFKPSMVTIAASEKIFDAEAPRYLEEEGFYVGVRPAVPQRNQNKLEARLLAQRDQGKGWFGEDGRVIALPDPIKDVPSRPPVPEEPEPALETEYRKAVTKEFDGRYIDGVQETVGQYQLDVDINTVIFTHHHLFSREHTLATKLTELYNQYLGRNQKKIVTFLTEKLRALKRALNHVEENMKNLALSEGKGDTPPIEQDRMAQGYREEVRQTRKQRDNEMQADRTLMKSIIKTWKDIRNLREFQNFNNTPVKLQITKEKTNKEEDEAEWEADIEEEVQEIRQEKEDEYNQKYAIYKTKLDEWKKYKLARKEALKRQKKRDKQAAKSQSSRTDVQEIASGEDEEHEDHEQAEKDRNILDGEEVVKPEKPEAVVDDMLKDKIRQKYMEIRRRPGEPKLYPELTNGATVTPAHQCPRGEQNRRDDVNRFKVYVKVLFNNKEVSRTSVKPIGQDFIVRFAQIFNVQIVQWPENIKVQLFEKSGLSETFLAEMFMSIPEANVTITTVQLDEMEFSSDQRVAHGHEGVGSGVPFSFESDNSNQISLMTTGSLSCCVSWAVDEQGNTMVPPMSAQGPQLYNARKGMDAVAAIGASGVADMDKLTKWIAQSRLDPNDPSNADLMYLLRPVGGGDMVMPSMRMPEHFRLEQLQEEFNFTTDEDMAISRRFRLLQFRDTEVPEFRNYKMIPALDKEVPQDAFAEYEKKRKEEEKLKSKDEVESHRIAVAKFMQRVREQVMMRFRLASHEKTLQDVVFEDAVPNIGTILPSLLKMTEPRRPLKPIRKERKKVNPQNLQNMDVNILVNIVRAFDIPVRADALPGSRSPASVSPREGTSGTGVPKPKSTIRNIAGELQPLVRPFVEVMFQRNVHSTSVAEGPNPSWNEELQVPFRAPNNDYTATNLQTVNDVLYFSLFDECIVDVLEDERDRGTAIHRRIEKKWLGSLKIPFSTVYFNSRIDGTFRVNKPPVLLGYTHDTTNKNIDGIDMGIGDAEHTYLSMFVTIEPQLAPAEPFKEKTIQILKIYFDSNEDMKLLEYADSWLTELVKKFPKREYKATVVDINGKSVFITRYFKALKPPEELVGSDVASEKVARFVSMIPFVSDSVVFPGLCDIWSTCDQFLQMLQGDEEEHAVMLTCLLLHLGKRAWLLLGTAIPEGPTAYVITQEDKDYWIWNASTGSHYSYRDNYCPVQSVGCLVNADNIWANIQQNEQPCRMSFDLSNTSNWKPFFTKSFPNPGITSVQPENLIYLPTDKSYVSELQDKIERILKERLMGWRPRNITRWNRYCMQAFRQLLLKLEDARGRGAQDDHQGELQGILGQYKISGFPINQPYTEIEPLVDAVYATGVHNNESSDVEFALAVHIHPYPNTVLSVWVYVASLIRKR